MDYTAPHSLEAEEAILGGVILDNAAIAKVNLQPDDFYLSKHQKIWKAILRLSGEDLPIDLFHIAQCLSDGDLKHIGGVPFLAQLVDTAIGVATIDRLALIVRQKHQRRKLIKYCSEIIADAYDQSIPWDDLRTSADARLTSAIAEGTETRGLKHIADILPDVLKDLEEGKNPATPTGLNSLDHFLGGGIRGGELIVVAARPSMGKTFVGQFLARLLANKGPVCFFSCEMDSAAIAKRFWATESNIPQTQLTSNAVDAKKADALIAGMTSLSAVPIHIDDTPGNLVTVPYLQSECHKIYRQHKSIGLIVVDYLQLIGDQGSTNRVGELGRYSSALKSMAKQFDCPVIALSQLSRGVESRNDKRPIMSDIRSSGAIEQDADVILMLYRDEYYNPNTEDAGILELIIAKNRSGSAGVTAKAEFDPSVGTITNFVNYSSMGV